MEPNKISSSNLPIIDVNLPNIHSEKSTSIQTIVTKQLSCEPNRATGSKKRKYGLREMDQNELKGESDKRLLKRTKQNLSSSSDNQQEIHNKETPSDEERMEIDSYGEGSENGETSIVRGKIEEKSPW
jgi:hypothetical protein